MTEKPLAGCATGFRPTYFLAELTYSTTAVSVRSMLAWLTGLPFLPCCQALPRLPALFLEQVGGTGGRMFA